MTHPQDDDLAAWLATDADLAALLPSPADWDRWEAEAAERAHRAWLVAEADRRGLVSRRRALFLQGRAPVRPRRGERRDDDDPPPADAA